MFFFPLTRLEFVLSFLIPKKSAVNGLSLVEVLIRLMIGDLQKLVEYQEYFGCRDRDKDQRLYCLFLKS